MRRITVYILSLGIFLQSIQLHAEEIQGLRLLVRDANEHLQAGDSFWEFLQKHYGDQYTVQKHLNDKHPDRQQKEKHKHTHHLEPVHAWDFRTETIRIFNPVPSKRKDVFYHKFFLSAAYLQPPFSPPERR